MQAPTHVTQQPATHTLAQPPADHTYHHPTLATAGADLVMRLLPVVCASEYRRFMERVEEMRKAADAAAEEEAAAQRAAVKAKNAQLVRTPLL